MHERTHIPQSPDGTHWAGTRTEKGKLQCSPKDTSVQYLWNDNEMALSHPGPLTAEARPEEQSKWPESAKPLVESGSPVHPQNGVHSLLSAGCQAQRPEYSQGNTALQSHLAPRPTPSPTGAKPAGFKGGLSTLTGDLDRTLSLEALHPEMREVTIRSVLRRIQLCSTGTEDPEDQPRSVQRKGKHPRRRSQPSSPPRLADARTEGRAQRHSPVIERARSRTGAQRPQAGSSVQGG